MSTKRNRDYLGFIPGIVGLTKLVLRFFHNLADLTLVTSPQLKEEMEQWGIKRIAVWRKGIDTQVQAHTRQRGGVGLSTSHGFLLVDAERFDSHCFDEAMMRRRKGWG